MPEINLNDGAERFELADAPEAAYLAYRQSEDRVTLVHTEVADELEGQGIGSALVREALLYAENNGLTVEPQCPFVAGWLDRHPERASRLDVAAP